MRELRIAARPRYNRSDFAAAQACFCTAARPAKGGLAMTMQMSMGIVRMTALAASLFVTHAFAGDYRVPRLPDGAPDLQGVWTNATATPMERSPELGERRAYTEQEAAAISKAALAAVAADAAPSDPSKKIEAADSLPPVGNYNLFWTDR